MLQDSLFLRRSSVIEPSVTVIITAYNGARYIADAIDSILAQTFTCFELLIIDDCSSDNTLEIISFYKDSRITLVQNNKNNGAACSMNIGLSLARSKYTARMDQDDIAHPDRLQKQYLFMERNPHVGVCGTWAESFGVSSSLMKMPISDREIRAMLFFDCPLIHPSTMLRKSVLLELPSIYSNVLAEDYDLWLRLSALCEFHNIPEVLLRYRTHPEQITSRHVLPLLHSAMSVRYIQAEALLGRKLSQNEMPSLSALTLRHSDIDVFFASISLCIELARANRYAGKYNHAYFIGELYKRLFSFLRKASRPSLNKRIFFLFENILNLIKEFGLPRTLKLIKRILKPAQKKPTSNEVYS